MTGDPLGADDRAAQAVVMAARAHERDRYLTALLAPRTVRPDLINLAAFQGEIARIPLFVTDPMIGEIRLQWWRDTITNAEAGVLSGNPIADAFTRTMRRHQLSPGLIGGLIDAQALALYPPEPPRDELALQQHLTKSDGAAFELAAKTLKGQPLDGAEGAFCRNVGVAYGLARTATEFAAVSAQGRTLLPADWLAGADLAVTDLDGANRSGDWVKLVNRLADEGATRALRLSKRHGGKTHAVRAACRALAMVPAYANAVRRSGEDITRASADVLPLTRVWRIWRGC